MIAQGAHPQYIQAQLGHASIQTTLDRYGHLSPSCTRARRRSLMSWCSGSRPRRRRVGSRRCASGGRRVRAKREQKTRKG
jgi:hypothetical protein